MANTGTDNLFDNKMYQAQKILESVNFNFIPDIKESNMHYRRIIMIEFYIRSILLIRIVCKYYQPYRLINLTKKK